MSADGLAILRGDGEAVRERDARGEGEDLEDDDAPGSPATPAPTRSPANSRRWIARSTAAPSSSPAARPGRLARDPLIYDPDWEEGERLEAWRRAAAGDQSEPPLLAAALLWDAWETNPPLERQAWLGNLLVAARCGSGGKRGRICCCVNSALRHIRREKRRSPDRLTRLNAFLEAIAAGAEAGMKDHDRWLLARRSLEGKLKGHRSSSRCPLWWSSFSRGRSPRPA